MTIPCCQGEGGYHFKDKQDVPIEGAQFMGDVPLTSRIFLGGGGSGGYFFIKDLIIRYIDKYQPHRVT